MFWTDGWWVYWAALTYAVGLAGWFWGLYKIETPEH
jgi:hypothetical protein